MFISSFFQSDAGWEEYYDYIFPDEEAAQPNLKLLAMAKKWKQVQETTPAEEEEEVGWTSWLSLPVQLLFAMWNIHSLYKCLSVRNDNSDCAGHGMKGTEWEEMWCSTGSWSQ